jgi:hypothetical protein
VADSTLSSGDSASPPVIRCAECHELVPADRVRHREERVKVAARPRPGRWRAGGPPIFQAPTHGPRLGPGARPAMQGAPPPPRSAYAIERIPVCEDCLRRQRMGLYAITGIVASCVLVAVALYSREPAPPPYSQQVALAPAVTPEPTLQPTAPPKPEAPAVATPLAPPPETEADDARPIWEPIWEATTNLLSSLSAAQAPDMPASEDTPPVIASASPSAPATPAAPTTAPTPRAEATGSVAAPPTDGAAADSATPPVWATKPARKVAKATPARRNVPATNAVALRTNGYAALGQGRYGEAMSLLQQATMMGDAYAPMYIGQLYERGMGVPRDVGQASYWYGIAINRGNGTALVAFNRLRMNPY